MSHGTFLEILSWVKTSMMPSLNFGWEEVREKSDINGIKLMQIKNIAIFSRLSPCLCVPYSSVNDDG